MAKRRVIAITKPVACGVCGDENVGNWIAMVEDTTKEGIKSGEIHPRKGWRTYRRFGGKINLCDSCYEDFAPYTIKAEKRPMIRFVEE